MLRDDEADGILSGSGRGHPWSVVNRGEFTEDLVRTDYTKNDSLAVNLFMDLDLAGFDDECGATRIGFGAWT